MPIFGMLDRGQQDQIPASGIGGILARHGTNYAQSAQGLINQSREAVIAADRLDSMGDPEAAKMAMLLRQNPQAGFKMISDYGGYGNFESMILSKKARGEALAAGGTEQQVMEALLRNNPDDAFKYAQSTNMLRESKSSDAFGSGVKMSDLRAIRKELMDLSGDYNVQMEYFNRAKSADVGNKGPSDFLLVQAVGKMIDPNSVVRETEAGFISSSASSSLQDFLNRINKIYAPSGNLAPEARLGLIRQLNSLAKQATMFQAQRVARHSGEMKNLGFNNQALDFLVPDSIIPNVNLNDPKSTSKFFIREEPWLADANRVAIIRGTAHLKSTQTEPVPESQDDMEQGVVYSTKDGRRLYVDEEGKIVVIAPDEIE